MKSKNHIEEPLNVIRAYCSDCGKLLMESNHMTKKQLLVNWDDAVIGAAGIPCPDCHPTLPNFHITLKIYHKALDKEFDPASVLPTPKNTPDMGIPDYLLEPLKSEKKSLD